MNNNGKAGPIRATAGQEAQESRQHLDALLGGIVASRHEINRQRLVAGQEPVPEGITIREQEAPTLIAAHAICTHLHHLTVKLEEVRQDLTLVTDELREGLGQIYTNLPEGVES